MYCIFTFFRVLQLLKTQFSHILPPSLKSKGHFSVWWEHAVIPQLPGATTTFFPNAFLSSYLHIYYYTIVPQLQTTKIKQVSQ